MYEIKYIKMYFIIELYIIKFFLRSSYMICVHEFFLSARECLNISLQYPVGDQDGDLGILLNEWGGIWGQEGFCRVCCFYHMVLALPS